MHNKIWEACGLALLRAQNLCLSFSDRLLFENISFDVESKDKIGFIGANGVGKTTIFKILSGQLQPAQGDVFVAKDIQIGYMEQHAGVEKDRTVYSELLSVFSHFEKMEQELELLAAQIEKNGKDIDTLVARQLSLQEQYENNGGLTYKSRTRAALLGLGFTEADMHRTASTLSGGQLSKLKLAKLLLSGANLLLLDEPTNHLDIASVEWLESFMKDFKGAAVIISHDRYFLDAVTNKTMELSHGRLTAYSGNYTQFMQKKEKINEDLKRRYENEIKEIKRIEGIVEQQRRWGQSHNFITAASKQKQADRLKKALVKPEDDAQAIHFSLTPRRESGNDVLQCRDLSISFDGKPLFEGVNLHLTKGQRVFLLGANGCGKTTLFKILMGKHHAQGEIRFGANVDVGYFDQVQADLNLEKSALDEVWDAFPNMSQTQVRTALGTFLFKGDDVFKPVKMLSGGERARVALLKLMLHGSNFLLLDEPTNHLDTASREALEDTLKAYGGTMLIISHDRYFINKLADKVITLSPGGVCEYLGNYDAYLEKTKEASAGSTESHEKPQKAKNHAYFQRKEQQSQKRRLQTRLKKCEQQVEAEEKTIQDLEAMLESEEIAADFEKLTHLTTELEEHRQLLEQLIEQWTQLQLQLEVFPQE